MDYSEIVDALDTASGFDLYRLRSAIDHMIDDPKRMIEIKTALRFGQEIEYFEPAHHAPASVEGLALSMTQLG